MRMGRSLRALARDEAGVSAIEFGLVAPMIFFSFLAMTDVGFALNDRIRLDHFLRSGAQAALRDSGELNVIETLKRTTCGDGETYPACERLADVTFSADRYCYCPTTETTDTTCTSTCPVQPQRFYTLSAEKSYAGIFLPDMDFAPQVLVEVR